MKTTTEHYKEAIAELEAYREDEPDRDKREEATRRITRFRLAIQEANFDEMTRRADRLESLQRELQALIDAAGNGPGVAERLSGLSAMVLDIGAAIGSGTA